ncbi:MAG: ferritin [Asgard group archaeon]|nr:ferritin [Asgard group archaeon]
MALISEKINQAFNKQIQEELNSAYIYLSMSIWLKEHAYKNLSSWFFAQYNEELSHAYKFINYIIDVGGKVTLSQIPQPKSEWTSVEEIVKTAYTHEQYITNCIRDLVILTEQEKDFNPWQLLQWFVTEQIEEEANTEELVIRQAAFKNDMLFNQHTVRQAE